MNKIITYYTNLLYEGRFDLISWASRGGAFLGKILPLEASAPPWILEKYFFSGFLLFLYAKITTTEEGIVQESDFSPSPLPLRFSFVPRSLTFLQTPQFLRLRSSTFAIPSKASGNYKFAPPEKTSADAHV